MFQDYRHPIPKSRLKTIKIKAENGRFQRVPGLTHEEFSPSNRDHGARIFGKKAERGSGDDQITDILRDVAKIPTLGISYGLTPFGFVRRIRNELEMEFEIQEAQGFFETFFEMFPEIATYQAKAAEDALSVDRVCTIGGTRRWLPPLVDDRDGDYWPSFERRKKILINTPIEGSGADLVIWPSIGSCISCRKEWKSSTWYMMRSMPLSRERRSRQLSM